MSTASDQFPGLPEIGSAAGPQPEVIPHTPKRIPRPPFKKPEPYKAGDCAGINYHNGQPLSQKSGHIIVSLLTKHSVDPVNKTLIPIFEVLCSRCGRSLEEIRAEYRPKKPTATPK